MDWENERYIRVYTRDTGDILAIGWEGRAVLWPLMRVLDRAGVLDISDPGIVAELIRVPQEITAIGLARLIDRGIVESVDGCLVAPNFIAAQEAKQSDKQRAAESRARRREQARAGSLSRNVTPRAQNEPPSVTNRDETVTVSHGQSQSVTPSLAMPSQTTPSQAVPTEEPVQKKRAPRVIEPSAESLEIADGLRDYVLAENPSASCSKRYERKTWATTIEKLLKPGRYTPEQLRYAIGWLSGEQFGSGSEARFVVESANGFARKIDSIAANIKSQIRRGQGSERTSAADARLAAQLAIEAEEELEQLEAETEAQQ